MAGVARADPAPLPPPPIPIPPLPAPTYTPLNYHSPALKPCVDELPIPETRAATGELAAMSGAHRYHRDLPETRSWGFGRDVLGPNLEAWRDRVARIAFHNELGTHVLAPHVDLTMHGVTERDRTDPRFTVHLHGGANAPDADGHPLVGWRNGGGPRFTYTNRQEAAALWYHDHTMGITRLNIQAGLAGIYYVRDEFDTGRDDNPLGLPSGEFEIPLIVQDRTFNPDGSLQPMVATYIPEGYNQSGQVGDVACVNGKVWLLLRVRRTLYRFRILNGSNSRPYIFEFSNGMPCWAIGTDLGLLDTAVPTPSIRVSPGEQWDIVNSTPFDHPIHLHLARLRVIGRQPILTSAYWLANTPPAFGTRWTPSADPFAIGPQQGPPPWEVGWKDTIECPPTPSPESWCTGPRSRISTSTPTPP
ncbi:multicopper oxidase domain-containing protein [Nocardia sp. SYP-A9097]|uniref:multicopper oxidase domain-containing protein n=1 Tax=Nocardia sp. SYP-A9097 TaxID=2663237 RepID=UPI00189146E4|nr:multicopper oxidase domain-containing protein [Nocardia sp. SYP-A9097]